jgi:hypothetical protein
VYIERKETCLARGQQLSTMAIYWAPHQPNRFPLPIHVNAKTKGEAPKVIFIFLAKPKVDNKNILNAGCKSPSDLAAYIPFIFFFLILLYDYQLFSV